MRILLLALGGGSVLLGAAGTVLPLLPTTPFLLLAAWAFARSSPALHRRLLAHPHLGPPIRDWQRHGAISRPARRLAMLALVMVLGLGVALGSGPALLTLQALVLALVAAFVLSRPLPPG